MLTWPPSARGGSGQNAGVALDNMSVQPNGNELRQRLNSDRKSSKDDLRQDAEVELKRFIETNGHFSLVRYVGALTQQLSPCRRFYAHERLLWRAIDFYVGALPGDV